MRKVGSDGVGSKFKLGGGGHKLSGVLLDTESAPSNIIWILFDYIFFRTKKALHFKLLGGGSRAPCPLVPVPPLVERGRKN